MKIDSYLFGWALLSLTAISSAQEQQLCPSAEELFTNPDYQATDCILTDFVDDCGGCPATPTGEIVGESDRGIDCYTAEEQLCPTIRCCEQCWTKLQNYLQCFVVEPNWKSNMGGMIEDGCVLDCSRFPIGGDSDSPTDDDENDDDAPPQDPPEPPDSPIADTTNNSESSSANGGIYIRDEEFLEECRNARNNMMCQIENCQECGDDGYPSLAATQLEGIQEVGSFYDCGQMEEALCPEIRCCKECDYKLSEFWFQCNVVESAKDLGRTDTSCKIDCWDGDDNSLDVVSDKSEDAAAAISNGDGQDEEENVELLENGENSPVTSSSSGTFLAKPILWKAVMVVMIGAQAGIV